MKIIIPSHNRADAMISLNFIPASFKDNTFIAVRSGEQEKMYAKYSDRATILPFDNLTCLGDKRDAVARYFAGEKIWMVDDDCTLHNHKIDNKGLLKHGTVVSEKDFYEFVDYAEKLLDTNPLGVVWHCKFPRLAELMLPHIYNKYVYSNVFLNLKTLNADMLGYHGLPMGEDVTAFLKVFDLGYDNFLLTNWVINTKAPGRPGGCTDIRTVETLNKYAEYIQSQFPQHISFVNNGFKCGKIKLIKGTRINPRRIKPKKMNKPDNK